MTRVIMFRRLLVPLVTALLLTSAGATAEARSAPGRSAPERAPASTGTWTGTWEAAASGTLSALPGASIRNVVHTSVGGRAARVRLSNRLGTRALRLGAVTLALQPPGEPGSPRAVADSVRAVTFAGAASVTVPAGRDLVSDPVALPVPADANLLVSVHTPADSGPATCHHSALQTNFIAPAGDRTAEESGAAYTATVGSWYYVTGVDVLGASAAGSVVALGDSITDGTGSSPGANHRWPDRLAARLRGLPAHRRPGVLNAGISGNRVLLDGRGPSALTRLDADVFSRTGVRAMIVLEGVNDIKGTPEQTDPRVLEDAYRLVVRRAHARGIRVIGATITPYGGHAAYTPAREAVRRAVNAAVRTHRIFDGVADLDAAVRDPARPDRILPAYDPGDHLHFNDAGARALAGAIDLRSLLTPDGSRPR
ncbi:SGNH/GDSL hydrolase family protein [Streptomyces triticiradicis]|uniref:SGNH/GDSL hydrolase family protein n=1 Tax=Streptomyces triticiradicis TaxID=2651189 RepID=A0A7J5D8H6_9ACTN|nr:SGNH/GDSL hydrolase family protein [Streptomyces triticiradicis]KAB1979958.1 SGNH/GDSL hydrolase family protein [Streptomyces triticiradicis]